MITKAATVYGGSRNSQSSREDYRHSTSSRWRGSPRSIEMEFAELGVRSNSLINELVGAGFDRDSVRAVFLIPMIEMAWADGNVQIEEKAEVLRILSGFGIRHGSSAHHLIKKWLIDRPTDQQFQIAQRLALPLISELKASKTFRVEWIQEAARRVANASGSSFSLLGLDEKISQEEASLLNRLREELRAAG